MLQHAGVDFLELLDEGVIVMDERRQLRYLNGRARELLGFAADDDVTGRCRHTTRGIDCEASCPLSYAISTGRQWITGFRTAYRRKDDSLVALSVSVIVLSDESGNFAGAIELLKPSEPDPGVTCAGPSVLAQRLRQQLVELAAQDDVVSVVGEAAACVDVARALHRVAELRSELFRIWTGAGGMAQLPVFPPGTLFVDLDGAEPSAVQPEQWPGWRIVYGVREAKRAVPESALFVVPPLTDRQVDLPFLVAAAARQLDPAACLTASDVERLSRLTISDGLEALQHRLATEIAGRVGDAEPTESRLEELLAADDPLAAVEECVLREVLIRCGWRVQEAADQLGVSRVTLWRKLKEHGIERPCS